MPDPLPYGVMIWCPAYIMLAMLMVSRKYIYNGSRLRHDVMIWCPAYIYYAGHLPYKNELWLAANDAKSFKIDGVFSPSRHPHPALEGGVMNTSEKRLRKLYYSLVIHY
jgi:hypothetical protein